MNQLVLPFSDGLVSALTGLGNMDLDKHASLYPTYVPLDPVMLSNLWKGDWVARKAVQIPAADSTRMWRFWKADKKDIQKIEKVERTLNVQQKLLQALIRARLYGGAVIIIGVDDGQDVSQELNLKQVKRDSLKYLHVCTRYEVNVGPIEFDPAVSWYGRPQWYSAANKDPQKAVLPKKIHPTRVVHLLGNDNVASFTGMNDGWGDSILQSVYDALSAAGSTMQNIAHLIQEAKIDIIKTPDLQDQITGEGSEAKFTERWATTNKGKSLFRMIILDKAEEWERIGVNFAGMPEIMDAMFILTCAAVDVPATRFMSTSPKGLNATGESDLSNYYDRIKSDQEQTLSPAINQLDEVIIRSALGNRPDKLWYDWRPLWQLSEAERATADKTTSDMIVGLAGTGLIPTTALSKVVVNKLIENGVFPGLEDAMAEAEAAGDTIQPPMSPEEEAALRIKEEGQMRQLPPSKEAQAKQLTGPSAGNRPADGKKSFSPQERLDGYASRGRQYKDSLGDRLSNIEDALERLATGRPFGDFGQFEEEQHPRGSAGSGQGGKFVSKGLSKPQPGERTPGPAATSGESAVASVVKENVAKGAEAAKTRGVKALEGNQGHPGAIATRRLVGKDTKGAGYAEKYTQPTVEAMKEDPKTFARNMDLLKNSAYYPNMRPEDTKGLPTDIARAAVDHMKENLRFLYNKAQHLEEDKQWYDGARMIVDKKLEQYPKLDDMSVAGVYAALSPQKDWNQNVYLGDRLIAIHQEGQKAPWDDKMEATSKAIWKSPDALKGAEAIRGKSLGELKDMTEKAMWIRTYDEAHSDRKYAAISSTGERGPNVTTKAGGDAKAAWQSTPAIVSALQALESKGDRDIISEAIGNKHKVRSFYNNILDPHSPNGDVTSDTHHVGAALMRNLGGSTAPVMHNFGNALSKEEQAKSGGVWQATAKSVKTGVEGLYPLYGDATRELAKELKIEPRQLQSVVWTTKRTLFQNASQQDHDGIERAWQDYHNGHANLQETQQKVYNTLTATPQEKQATGLMERLQKEGGFTYNTNNNKSPKEGFMVSPYKDRERILDAKTITGSDLAKYVADNKDVLSQAKHHFGAWHNPDDGKIYLDVSVVTKTPAEAEKLSIKHEQLAYFDLKEMKTVDVGQMEAGVYKKKEPASATRGNA